MQIPVSSNIPHCKWWPRFWYYNDGSALDNSSEGPKICNYSAIAPDPSIMALCDRPWKGSATQQYSDKLLGALVLCRCCCCCCLFRRWKAKIDRQQENNKAGKYSKLRNFPFIERLSVLTPDLCTAEPGRKHFPKHNQSIVKQRKIIPRRNLMARLLNVSLFCQQEISPPTILWKSSHDVCFIAICHESKVDLSRRQNSKAFWSGHDWTKSLLMSLSVINYPSLSLAEGPFIPFPLLLKLRPVFGIEMSSHLSWTCNILIYWRSSPAFCGSEVLFCNEK